MIGLDRITALEAELQQQRRTIVFLATEYISRHPDERGRIAAFLKVMIPDMVPGQAAIAQSILDAVKRL